MKIVTLAFMFILSTWAQTVKDRNSQTNEQTPLTFEQVRPIIQRHVDDWNKRQPEWPLWVSLASPGDPINLPGVTFGSADRPNAGMELPIRAHVIVLNRTMVPESILTTFAHEVSHAEYRLAHPKDFNEIDSEIAAIKGSLTILLAEGFEYLAYREAKAAKDMSGVEPYRSAVERLATDPVWIKYSPKPPN